MTTRGAQLDSRRDHMATAKGPRVLLVEDQRDIAANVWDYFERRGYVMDHARDGRTGLALALQGHFDLLILDLGLPRLDGMDVCRQLRAAGHELPILMLTARDALDDKLKGLREGADDYVVKPVVLSELEARARALLRRGRPLPGASLRVADLELDTGSFVARRAGHELTLTRMQTLLLERLMRQSPRFVAHDELARLLWGDELREMAALHTHMHALRAAVDRGFEHPLIRTVRGMGYRLGAADHES